MKSVLEMLFDGEIRPGENSNAENDPEYSEVRRRISQELSKWQEKLTAEDFCKLEDFRGLCGEMGSLENSAVFCYGMKLGIMLMVEVFAGKAELAKAVE